MTHPSRRSLALGLAPLFALAACLGPKPEPLPTGAMDFADYCAACHGAGGTGNGAIAATLANRPANLTTLAARNGGTFPTTEVMAKIWGYTGGKDRAVMPNFGPLLDSETMPYDGGDGILTPTPIRLVQIAEHLKTLQPK
jgi:mono/diheme cytochrome c family protein